MLLYLLASASGLFAALAGMACAVALRNQKAPDKHISPIAPVAQLRPMNYEVERSRLERLYVKSSSFK